MDEFISRHLFVDWLNFQSVYSLKYRKMDRYSHMCTVVLKKIENESRTEVREAEYNDR